MPEAANNHHDTASIVALKPHIAVDMLHGRTLMGSRRGLEKVFQEFNASTRASPADAEKAMRLHLEGSRNRLFEDRVLDMSF